MGELRRRLILKGFDSDQVEAVLKELETKKILDDRAFALWWITQRSTLRPTGSFGLLMELRQKMVGEETAKRAVAESGVKEAEAELAREALQGRLARYLRLDPMTRRRRITGFLARRGFSSDTTSAIMRSLEKR